MSCCETGSARRIDPLSAWTTSSAVLRALATSSSGVKCSNRASLIRRAASSSRSFLTRRRSSSRRGAVRRSFGTPCSVNGLSFWPRVMYYKRDGRDGQRFEARNSRFLELRTLNLELRIAFFAAVSPVTPVSRSYPRGALYWVAGSVGIDSNEGGVHLRG